MLLRGGLCWTPVHGGCQSPSRSLFAIFLGEWAQGAARPRHGPPGVEAGAATGGGGSRRRWGPEPPMARRASPSVGPELPSGRRRRRAEHGSVGVPFDSSWRGGGALSSAGTPARSWRSPEHRGSSPPCRGRDRRPTKAIGRRIPRSVQHDRPSRRRTGRRSQRTAAPALPDRRTYTALPPARTPRSACQVARSRERLAGMSSGAPLSTRRSGPRRPAAEPGSGGSGRRAWPVSEAPPGRGGNGIRAGQPNGSSAGQKDKYTVRFEVRRSPGAIEKGTREWTSVTSNSARWQSKRRSDRVPRTRVHTPKSARLSRGGGCPGPRPSR